MYTWKITVQFMQIHKEYMNGFVALRDFEIVILHKNVQMSGGYNNKIRIFLKFIEKIR